MYCMVFIEVWIPKSFNLQKNTIIIILFLFINIFKKVHITVSLLKI